MEKFLELREVHIQEVEHVKLLETFFKNLIGHVPTTNSTVAVQLNYSSSIFTVHLSYIYRTVTVQLPYSYSTVSGPAWWLPSPIGGPIVGDGGSVRGGTTAALIY